MPSTRPSKTRGPNPCFAQHGLFFSTSTGKTEEVADLIQEVSTYNPRTEHPRQLWFGNITRCTAFQDRHRAEDLRI